LKIYLHFYFHRFITTFDIPTGLVELLAPETDLLPYILDSSILITDYSSVAWDFFYLDKPVLFFQPDLDTYLRERGSYLDLRTDLFGPQSFTPAELASQVDYAIEHHASLVEKYRPMKERYFAFHDAGNCRRIFQEFLRFKEQGR